MALRAAAIVLGILARAAVAVNNTGSGSSSWSNDLLLPVDTGSSTCPNGNVTVVGGVSYCACSPGFQGGGAWVNDSQPSFPPCFDVSHILHTPLPAQSQAFLRARERNAAALRNARDLTVQRVRAVHVPAPHLCVRAVLEVSCPVAHRSVSPRARAEHGARGGFGGARSSARRACAAQARGRAASGGGGGAAQTTARPTGGVRTHTGGTHPARSLS
jgi:hypothetical protein